MDLERIVKIASKTPTYNKEREEYKKVIEEQYKLINDLAKKLNKIK